MFKKLSALALIVIALAVCSSNSFAGKVVKLAVPLILNITNGKVKSPLIIKDCDSKMAPGTVLVFIDRKLVGVGGKKVGGTAKAPITKVTLSHVPKGKHRLYVTDGIARTVMYVIKN